MDGWFLILLLMAAIYWLFHLLFGRRSGRNSRSITHQIRPMEKVGLLARPGLYKDHLSPYQYDNSLRPGLFHEDYFRERDAHERHAKRQVTHIRNNMAEPDSEGFVRHRGFWRDGFVVRTPTGKTYRGHVRLDEANYMISIKEPGLGGRIHTLDLWDVEVE